MLKSKSFEKRFCDPLKSLLVLWQKAFDPLSKGIIVKQEDCRSFGCLCKKAKALRKAMYIPGPLKNGLAQAIKFCCLESLWSYGKACSRTCICGKKVLWSALGIDSVIDFLVLILAVFFMVFGIDFLIFLVLKKGPQKSIFIIDFWGHFFKTNWLYSIPDAQGNMVPKSCSSTSKKELGYKHPKTFTMYSKVPPPFWRLSAKRLDFRPQILFGGPHGPAVRSGRNVARAALDGSVPFCNNPCSSKMWARSPRTLPKV